MNKTGFMRKLNSSHIFWLIISLLASLTIWIYVTSQETEDYKQTFRGVQVELVGEDILNSRNISILDVSTNTVTVEISGPRRVVGSLNSDDLKAQIDVSNCKPGNAAMQYTIKYPDGTDTKGLRTRSSIPETISFTATNMTKTVVQVKGSFNGETAEGFTADGDPEFEPKTITVYGPEIYLKDIAEAWVDFGEHEIVSSTYSVETGFKLRNKDKEECSTTGLTFSEDTVTATLEISKQKKIPLVVNLIPAAGATKDNTKCTFQYDTITLSGDSEIIDELNQITIATIDLGDFEKTYTNTFDIKYPDGLKNDSGYTETMVTVEIVGLETKDFYVNEDNISFVNVTEGYKAELVTKELKIKLRGTPEKLEEINIENIRVVVDLEDYNTSVGNFNTNKVKISVDGFTDVGSIGEYEVNFDLKKE